MMQAEVVARRLLDVWNARDLDAFAEMLHDDARWYDCGMPEPPAVGRPALRAFASTILTAFPDFTYTIREPICVSADGTRCVFAWQINATASGWMRPPGFAPTGRRVSFPGVDVLDVRDGRISSIETYFDAAAAAEQLAGMRLRPKPGSIQEKILVAVQRLHARWLRRRASR
jgi:steroid delta-isomerase-like uncharacterized protein